MPLSIRTLVTTEWLKDTMMSSAEQPRWWWDGSGSFFFSLWTRKKLLTDLSNTHWNTQVHTSRKLQWLQTRVSEDWGHVLEVSVFLLSLWLMVSSCCLCVAGPAGLPQPGSRGRGAVEGLDGSSREAGVSVAPAERGLELHPLLVHHVTLLRCRVSSSGVFRPSGDARRRWAPALRSQDSASTETLV